MTILVTQHHQEQESVILVVGCNLQKCSNNICTCRRDWDCTGGQVCEIFGIFIVVFSSLFVKWKSNIQSCNHQKCTNDGQCILNKDWCDSDSYHYNCSGDQVCEIFALFCVYMVVNADVE